MKLTKEFRFEASHRLPDHPGKCRRLHGHSWVLVVEVEGAINELSGMVMDYVDIKKAVQPIIDELDHRHLGTWEGIPLEAAFEFSDSKVKWLAWDFNATSENLLVAIADRLEGVLNWSKLQLKETCTCEAILSKEEWEGM